MKRDRLLELSNDLPLSRERRFHHSSVSEVAPLVGCSGLLASWCYLVKGLTPKENSTSFH
jgi:hypothetical protein